MANAFCDSVKLKIYLNIENNIFCVHKSPQELKKIQINTLMGICLNIQLPRTILEAIAATKTTF